MKQKLLFIPLSGGILTLLSFFSPWLKYDRSLIPRMVENPGPDVITTSGFGTGGFLVTLAFISVLATLGTSTYYILDKKTFWKSRTSILISSGLGFLCVLLKLILLSRSLNSSMQETLDTLESIGFEMIEENYKKSLSLQFGGFGAAIGFIVTFTGAWNIPRSEPFVIDNE